MLQRQISVSGCDLKWQDAISLATQCLYVPVGSLQIRVGVYVSIQTGKKKKSKMRFPFLVMMLLSVRLSRPWGHLTSLFINLLAMEGLLSCPLSLSLSLSRAPSLFADFLSPSAWTFTDINEKACPSWFPLANQHERRVQERWWK